MVYKYTVVAIGRVKGKIMKKLISFLGVIAFLSGCASYSNYPNPALEIQRQFDKAKQTQIEKRITYSNEMRSWIRANKDSLIQILGNGYVTTTPPESNPDTVPAAIINRRGAEAYGATDCFINTMMQKKIELIQESRNEGLSDGNIKSVIIGLNNQEASGMSTVAKHEAEQLQNAKQQFLSTFSANRISTTEKKEYITYFEDCQIPICPPSENITTFSGMGWDSGPYAGEIHTPNYASCEEVQMPRKIVFFVGTNNTVVGYQDDRHYGSWNEYSTSIQSFTAIEKKTDGTPTGFIVDQKPQVNQQSNPSDIKTTPNDSDTYYNRGVNDDKQGNFTQAISDYSKAVEINPKDSAAYYNRGVIYDKQGNFSQAISDYSKAIELSPNLAQAYNNRGILNEKQGNFAQAISDFSKVIGLNPNEVTTYNIRGTVYEDQGNFSQAISDYTKAIEINPNQQASY